MSTMLEAPPRSITAEEALHWIGEGNWELIDGRKVETMPAGEEHGGVIANIVYALKAFTRQHGLGRVVTGEVGYVTRRKPDSVRAPDVAFTSKERLKGAPSPTWGAVIPDLAVEVLSPGDRPAELRRKCEMWLSVGVQVVWEVHPSTQRVFVHQVGISPIEKNVTDALNGGDLLRGFSLPVREIFEDA